MPLRMLSWGGLLVVWPAMVSNAAGLVDALPYTCIAHMSGAMPCIKGLVLRHGYVQCPPLCKRTLTRKPGGKGSVPLPRAHLPCPPLLTKLRLYNASLAAICNCVCLTWRRASRQIVNAIAIFMVTQAVFVAKTKLKQNGPRIVNC